MNEHFKKFHDSIQNAQDSVAEMESLTQKMQNSQFDSVEDNNAKQNFTLESENKPKTNYNIEMNVTDSVKNLAELDTDTIIADLEQLANTHPDRFTKPSDVFRLIRKIKENPTHFYRNNRLDMHLIGKFLEDDSFAEMGIVTDSGRIGHILQANDGKKRERSLNRRNNEGSLVGIVNSDTLTQDEMDELAQNALLANLDKTIPHDSLNQAEIEEQGERLSDSSKSNQITHKGWKL